MSPRLTDIADSSPGRLILEQAKVAVKERLGPATLTQMQVATYPSYGGVIEGMAIELSTYVLTEHLVRHPYEVEFSMQVPATWFQHLKAARMRPWILRRWPVRYRKIVRTQTVMFERDAMYPQASIMPPELGKPVVFERWSKPWPST